MAVLRMTDSELLFSVAGVARMVNVPKEAVRDAIRQKRLRAETILIGDRIGISIPLSAVAEFWNLPRDRVRTIQAEAGQSAPNAPVSVMTPRKREGWLSTSEPHLPDASIEEFPTIEAMDSAANLAAPL